MDGFMIVGLSGLAIGIVGLAIIRYFDRKDERPNGTGGSPQGPNGERDKRYR
jgi:hypothetical protein